MYFSGIASGSLLFEKRKPTGATAEKGLGICPKRCQNVLFDGSLPLQSMAPNFMFDVTDRRLDAPRNPSAIVTFSFAHCSIQGSPPKKTCMDPAVDVSAERRGHRGRGYVARVQPYPCGGRAMLGRRGPKDRGAEQGSEEGAKGRVERQRIRGNSPL